MMKTLVVMAVALVLAWQPMPVGADEMQDRPKIGLALSGGGARGGAHIGVLKKLEELSVPIDYIAGTSMGAIVGALYASGYSPAEIETLMEETDWGTALTDRPKRRDRTMRKKDLDRQLLIPYRVGFNKGSFQFPMGAVEGQHLDQMFHRLLLHVAQVEDFDNLRVPFRAVATDLETGEEVVIGHGSLPDAIRASMSVPPFFAPVQVDGHLLVDGGMANNLPVSVVREMGADIVIAVDISTPLLAGKELDSVLSVAEQLTSFLTRRNTEVQLASLTPQDILLVPDLEGVSSADFTHAAEAATFGYEAASNFGSELAALATRQAQTESRFAHSPASISNPMIQFITLNNQSALDDEIILSRIGASPGQAVDLQALDRNMDEIYSLDVFQSVTYSLVDNPAGQRGLLIDALPRTWGPNYLQLGLEFSDDFSGNSDFKASAAYTRNALNPYGGELRVLGAFGREDELHFDFYQPIDKAARWYVESDLYYRRDRFDVYQESQLISRLDIGGVGASLDLGRNFDTTNRVSLRYNYFRGDADQRVGPTGLVVDDNVRVGELVLKYEHDSLDSVYFPTEGFANSLAYSYASDALGAGSDYEQAIFQASKAWSFGRNIILAHAEGAYSFDDLAPLERWFRLGGFARLSGLIPDQLFGRHMGLASLTYMRKLVDMDIAPVYAGITAEAGNVWEFEDDISAGDLQNAGSLFLGAETPIGPVYLAWGYHESGDTTWYFYLGNPLGFRTF